MMLPADQLAPYAGLTGGAALGGSNGRSPCRPVSAPYSAATVATGRSAPTATPTTQPDPPPRSHGPSDLAVTFRRALSRSSVGSDVAVGTTVMPPLASYRTNFTSASVSTPRWRR